MKKPLLLLLLAILLAACSEPEPLTQESLDNLNCQPGDLPRDQTYQEVENRQPSLKMFLGQDPALVSNKTWNDISSSRQTFSCTIFVFDDVQLAENGLQRACDELTPPIRTPNVGELSCQSGQQEVILVYQKDVYLVWIWADYEGKGILDVSKRVLDKLVNR